MAQVLINFGVPEEGFVRTLKGHTLYFPPQGQAFSRERLFSLLPQMEAVVACKPFTQEMIQAAPKLRLIVCYGSGYDGIDVEAAWERKITVCGIPSSVTASTAELTVALMLSLARQLNFFDRVSRGEESSSFFCMGKAMGVLLQGCTLGVVGMGAIGSRVADISAALGMRILFVSKTPKPHLEALGYRQTALPELMRQADFITLHCPLNRETTGLISREMLNLMKPEAYLINTARGAIVDQQALADALRAHVLAGAALDVYENEPFISPALCALDNVLLTPHIGANTAATRRLMGEECGRRISAFFQGETPENLISPPRASR